MNKKNKYILLSVILLIAAVLPLVIKTPYIIHIFIMTFYIGTASIAWSVLGGMAGQFSLGHATFMALGAYTTSLLLVKAGITPWIGMFAGAIVTGLISVLIFYPCFVLKGPYFSLATIAFAETFRNLFVNWKYAGQAQGILLPFGQDSIFFIRFLSKVPYYYISLVMLILVTIIVVVINKSKFGFAFKTIREDEDTANSIGINVSRYKAYAAFMSTSLTAIAGAFYSQYIRFIDPDIMHTAYSIEFILPAIIGGIAFIGGPLLGAVLLIPLSEFLRATIGTSLQGAHVIVYALILIIMIMLQPKGIIGWYQTSKIKKMIDKKYGGI